MKLFFLLMMVIPSAQGLAIKCPNKHELSMKAQPMVIEAMKKNGNDVLKARGEWDSIARKLEKECPGWKKNDYQSTLENSFKALK